MGIWGTLPTSAQPELTLVRWRVFEIEDGAWHLVGFCIENHEGRVSSPVTGIDPVAAAATTYTGRTYRLDGPPGHDGHGDYVWSRWLAGYNTVVAHDRTDEVYAEICRAAHP